MRVSKFLGSVLAVGALLVGATATTESRADDDTGLVSVTCAGGNLTVTAAKPWHTNDKAPWKWDKGAISEKTEHHVAGKGDKCEGTVKAYICNGDACKGPIAVPVK
jgi:hypothetical protein